MTKRRLSEMEVVEIDAIDLGDWERNMSTSEVPAAHLAPLVRQTKAQSVVAPLPKPEVARAVHTPLPVRQTSPEVASTPAPSTITPATEALPPRREAPKVRPRVSPRVMLLAGAAAVVVVLVVVVAVHGSGSTPATAEPVAQASAAPAPAAPSAPQSPSPSHAAVAKTDAPSSPATKPDVARVVKPDVSHSKPAPAHHSHASHHHVAAHKTVAARSSHAEAPVDTGEVDRAREAYNAGNEALFAGHFDDAIRSYKEAVDVSPTLAFGHRGLGLAYAQQGDKPAAIAAFREYLRLAPHAKDAALIRKRIAGLQH